jgi:predicted  nucleic acid-binding Zn-ribbon protein
MDSTLPRSSRDKRSELPQRSLGTINHVPKFQNDLVANLDFIRYRKANEPPSQEIIRLQNYSNYQSICLAQNIDDIAQDVVKTRAHLNSLHSEIDQVMQNQDDIRKAIGNLLEKLEIIEEAVKNMRTHHDFYG